MCIETLLSRLEGVRQTGPASWEARCPAHEDHHPSLSIREVDEEVVLIHCFAECETYQVLAAVGLDLKDLYPSEQHHGPPLRQPFSALDALRAVAYEALLVAVAATAMARGEALPAEDYERLLIAKSRIETAIAVVVPEYWRNGHA